MTEYKPTKETKKLVRNAIKDFPPRHGCKVPGCNGVRYYQLGGRTFCESEADREKVLTAYKAK